MALALVFVVGGVHVEGEAGVATSGVTGCGGGADVAASFFRGWKKLEILGWEAGWGRLGGIFCYFVGV